MAEKLQVGQKLVLDFIGGEVEGVITKVGRKWANVETPSIRGARNDMRIDMDDLRLYVANRNYPVCSAYLSLEHRAKAYAERREEMASAEAWRDFIEALTCVKPRGITTDAIRQAAALLGIQLPTDTREEAP